MHIIILQKPYNIVVCHLDVHCVTVQSVGTASGTGRSSSGNQVSDASLPEAREVRAGGKRFYFDVLQNDRGVFLKLSEVLVFNASMQA